MVIVVAQSQYSPKPSALQPTARTARSPYVHTYIHSFIYSFIRSFSLICTSFAHIHIYTFLAAGWRAEDSDHP